MPTRPESEMMRFAGKDRRVRLSINPDQTEFMRGMSLPKRINRPGRLIITDDGLIFWKPDQGAMVLVRDTSTATP